MSNTVVLKSTKNADVKPISYWTLFRFATPTERVFMFIALLLSSLAGASFPASTLVFGDLVNQFALWQAQPFVGALISADELARVTANTSVYFVYLGIITFITTYAYMAVFVYCSESSCYRIRREYLKAVMRQDISWFDNVGPGEVATRITSDTLLIQDAIGEKLPMAVSSISTFIVGFIIAFTKSWKMTAVLMSVVPLIAASGFVMNIVSGRFQTRILNLYSTAGNVAEESISAIRTVTSMNAQAKMSSYYNNSLASARVEGIKKSFTTGIGLGSLFFFIYNAYALAFWYGHILLQNNEIDTGSVVNVFFAVLIGAFALGQLAPDLQAFAFGIGAGTKIFQAIDRVSPIDSSSQEGEVVDRKAFSGKVELKNVNFTYPSRPGVKVLDNVSLVIQPGTTVALVGQSGSGKSTIVQLLERFYDTSSGSIEIDGKPIKSLNINSLRQAIGLVSQEPILFEGTVAENVANGLVGSEFENAPEEEKMKLVIDACVQANANDFIMKLPNQYTTQVGERGMLLSGGQKQRIAIARAIIKDPKILLLDEATSALDTASERLVQEALDRVSKSRTTITIAHRLSTIRDADCIVTMVHGQIIEKGTHAELLTKGGLYANLVEAQQLHNERKPSTPVAEVDPDAIPILNSTEHLDVTDTKGSGPIDVETGGVAQLSTRSIVYEILKINSPELKFTIPALISSMILGLVFPIYALVFANIIDAFSTRGSQLENEAKKWCVFFVILACGYFIFTFLQNGLFGLASEYLTERLRKSMFRAILNQEIGYFDDDKNSTGSLTSNLSTDAQRVQGVSGVTLGAILQILTTLVASLIVSFYFGWKLAAVATAALPFLILSNKFRMDIFTYFSEKSKENYQKSAQVACEAVASIRTVQSLTREKAVFEAYSAYLQEPLRNGYKSALLNTPLYALATAFSFMINFIVFLYGGRLMAYEGYTTKTFFTVFVAIIFGANGIGRIFAYAPDLNKAKNAGQAILKLLNRKPMIDSASLASGEKITQLEGHVRFADVKFTYPHRPEVKVLRGLNIEVKPGQFAALVGPSGCGKSTSIGLLERFYNVSGGEILIDKKNLSLYNVTEYRKQIGLVSQEPNLFDLSIKENICFGLDYIPSQEEIERVCKEANIHDFIISQPDKYDTKVGPKGGQMSGGQKQRISIARALIRNPKILLLDEATSALDAESEKLVQEALDKASKGRTTIAIAHRLSSIQHADIIFVLKDGVVVEKGTHYELYQKGGVYHELAVQQNLNIV